MASPLFVLLENIHLPLNVVALNHSVGVGVVLAYDLLRIDFRGLLLDIGAPLVCEVQTKPFQLASYLLVCLVGAIAHRHLVRFDVLDVIHIYERALSQPFLIRKGERGLIKQLLRVLDVLILIICGICEVRHEHRVVPAEDFCSVFVVFGQKLPPKVRLPHLEGHLELKTRSQHWVFGQESLAVLF